MSDYNTLFKSYHYDHFFQYSNRRARRRIPVLSIVTWKILIGFISIVVIGGLVVGVIVPRIVAGANTGNTNTKTTGKKIYDLTSYDHCWIKNFSFHFF